MHDKMMKMLMSKKKEGKTLSDSDKKSKLQALTGMRDMASQMMGDKLKNLKKVTVAADSKPALQDGLHKAEDLVNKSPEEDNGASMMNEGGMAKMPPEFDTDEANEDEHENTDLSPESAAHEASESPSEEHQEQESLDKILADSPNDPDDLDELIKKLEEKKQQLSR